MTVPVIEANAGRAISTARAAKKRARMERLLLLSKRTTTCWWCVLRRNRETKVFVRFLMRKRPVSDDVLRARLDALVATFDISTIEPDPLQLVHRFSDPRDQEVAALIAA